MHPFCLAAWSADRSASSETLICPDLRLVEPEPIQSICGRVLAPDGSPVAFAHVHSERFDERRGDWKEVRGRTRRVLFRARRRKQGGDVGRAR